MCIHSQIQCYTTYKNVSIDSVTRSNQMDTYSIRCYRSHHFDKLDCNGNLEGQNGRVDQHKDRREWRGWSTQGQKGMEGLINTRTEGDGGVGQHKDKREWRG